MANADDDLTLVPVTDLLEGRSARAVARLCRTGAIPAAVKVGQVWMITRGAWRAYLAGRFVPTGNAAEDDLRRSGWTFGR